MYTCTHTRAQASKSQVHARTHTHMRTRARTFTHTHTYTLTHTHPHMKASRFSSTSCIPDGLRHSMLMCEVVACVRHLPARAPVIIVSLTVKRLVGFRFAKVLQSSSKRTSCRARYGTAEQDGTVSNFDTCSRSRRP